MTIEITYKNPIDVLKNKDYKNMKIDEQFVLHISDMNGNIVETILQNAKNSGVFLVYKYVDNSIFFYCYDRQNKVLRDGLDEKILNHIATKDGMSVKDIALGLNIPAGTVENALQYLKENDRVIEHPVFNGRKGRPKKMYFVK